MAANTTTTSSSPSTSYVSVHRGFLFFRSLSLVLLFLIVTCPYCHVTASTSVDDSNNDNNNNINSDDNNNSDNGGVPLPINSTVACTRGSQRTMHQLACNENELLTIDRIFYGATPTSSGCTMGASYNQCCDQDLGRDCVFESDYKLDEYAVKCTDNDKHECQFSGQSVNSVRGDCSRDEFPSITSYSFMEYSCLDKDNLFNVCPSTETYTNGVKLFLDSNLKYNNEHLNSEDDCNCVLYTRCGATITVNAILVQLRKINSTDCVEELTVRDLKNNSVYAEFSCHDHKSNLAINNRVLLESSSNAVMLQLHIFEKHNGIIVISAESSEPATNTLGIRCGPEVSARSLPLEYYCAGETTPSPTTAEVEHDDPTTPMGTISTSTTSSDDDLNSGDSESLEGNNDNDNDDDDGNKGDTVIVKEEADDLHAGAIAGIVLAAVGILLVLSQVLYFLMRRRQKNLDRLEEESGRSHSTGYSFGSSLSPNQMVNPTFQHDDGTIGNDDTHGNNDNNVDYDDDYEHVYDLAMGTVSGRGNRGLYNTFIAPDLPVDDGDGAMSVGASSLPEKALEDYGDKPEMDADDYTVLHDMKEYGYEQPPPPYDPNDG